MFWTVVVTNASYAHPIMWHAGTESKPTWRIQLIPTVMKNDAQIYYKNSSSCVNTCSGLLKEANYADIYTWWNDQFPAKNNNYYYSGRRLKDNINFQVSGYVHFFSIPSQFESIENTCRIKQEVCKNSSIFWMRGRTNKSEINFLHSKWFWIWKIFLPVLSYVFTTSRNVPHKRCCL
jgi:hypothetical protein